MILGAGVERIVARFWVRKGRAATRADGVEKLMTPVDSEEKERGVNSWCREGYSTNW